MTTPAPRTKILLIENDQQAANSIRAALSVTADSLLDVEWVRHLTEGLDCLSKKGIAAVLLNIVTVEAPLPAIERLPTDAKVPGHVRREFRPLK